MDIFLLLELNRAAPGDDALRWISALLQVDCRTVSWPFDVCLWQHPASIELTMRLE